MLPVSNQRHPHFPTNPTITACGVSVLQPPASSATDCGMASHNPLPWKLHSGKSPSSGALTIEQIQRIDAQHGFNDGPLLDLSRKLAGAQSDPLNLSQPELAAAKKERGGREAQKAIKDLKRAEKAVAKAREAVDLLRFSNPYAHTGMPNPAEQHLASFISAADNIADFRKYLETMTRAELVGYGDHPNRRKARDLRKEIVCWTVFGFWEERGRPLSFTTDYKTSERGGDLFAFVNAIVECMTDPPTQISGETLKRDLGLFLDFREEER
ncbi:MAG: hypothetical protein ACP5DX_17040 [Paracoccaceae bacterium]